MALGYWCLRSFPPKKRRGGNLVGSYGQLPQSVAGDTLHASTIFLPADVHRLTN